MLPFKVALENALAHYMDGKINRKTKSTSYKLLRNGRTYLREQPLRNVFFMAK
uniref:Uncharacterized protein n=1 Tax=Anguilla anguilla TaxID=7936 RepID=A0A0E9TAA5_ANGAN